MFWPERDSLADAQVSTSAKHQVLVLDNAAVSNSDVIQFQHSDTNGQHEN